MALTAEELGRRIAAARERAGHTQEVVAEALQIPRSAVSLLENGQRQVTGMELLRLAEFFGMEVSDLLEGASPRQDLVKMFRLAAPFARAPEAAEAAVDALVPVCQIIEELETLLAEEAPPRRLPTYTVPLVRRAAAEQGRELARRERERLGLGYGPIVDLPGLLLAQGVVVAEHALPEGVSGVSFVFRRRPFTLIQPEESVWRRRLSLAHEYAHALVDHDIGGGLVVSRVGDAGARERRANAFAGAFLLPPEAIVEFSNEVGRVPDAWDFTHVVQLAQRFHVSYAATLVQLAMSGAITPEREAALKAKEANAAGYRNARWPAHEPPSGRSSLHQWAWLRCLRAYEHDHVSRRKALDIAAALGIPADRAEAQLRLAEVLAGEEE